VYRLRIKDAIYLGSACICATLVYFIVELVPELTLIGHKTQIRKDMEIRGHLGVDHARAQRISMPHY
jgi:hypothetical protein